MLSIISINIARGLLENELVNFIQLHKTKTDIFCFQEIDPPFSERITDLLSDDFIVHRAKKQNIDATYYIATYVRKNIKFIEAETPLKTIDGAGNALSVSVMRGGNKYNVTNVHGACYPGHKLDTPERLAQSQALLKFAVAKPGTHIFMGDFNLMPRSQSVTTFQKHGFINLIKKYHIYTTRNWVTWKKYPKNKQRYADYAFIKGDRKLSYDFVVDKDVVSDHLALRLSVSNTSKTR